MFIVILFLTCAPIQTIFSSSQFSSDLHIKYGGHALNALQRLLNFFESDANHLNLDGLYGLRIAQGQLNALHQALISPEDKQMYVTDKNNIINTLSTQIELIANMSLNQIARDASLYLHRFSLIAHKPFVIEYETRKIHKNLIETGERNSAFDEDESDKCFAELLGSSQQPNSTKCFISQSCWNMMTAPKAKDYRLTHQLLWFLIAKNIGCVNENNSKKRLNHFEDYFCSNIYEDAKRNLHKNTNQDLFLEQLLTCSIIGYEEFLRFDWLNTILTWQHPDYDCFSDELAKNRFQYHSKRELLFEQEMKNGCLAHKSGLAAGLLATYTRAFLQLNLYKNK